MLMRMEISKGRVVAAAVMMCCAAAVGAFIIARTTQTASPLEAQPNTPRVPGLADDPMDAIFRANDPLFVGEKPSTLSEAVTVADEAGFEIYTPEGTTLPTADKSAEVWVSSKTANVALRYGSSLVIEEYEWDPTNDPAGHFAEQAAALGVGYATTIAGNPAYVREAGDDSTANGFGITTGALDTTVIEIIVNDDTEVVLLGRDLTVADLVVVAESLNRRG